MIRCGPGDGWAPRPVLLEKVELGCRAQRGKTIYFPLSVAEAGADWSEKKIQSIGEWTNPPARRSRIPHVKGDEKKTRQRPDWARRSLAVGSGTAAAFAAVAATELAPVMARAHNDELLLQPEILALLMLFARVPAIAAPRFRRTGTAGVPVLGASGASGAIGAVAATSRPHATHFTNAPPSVAAAAAASTGAGMLARLRACIPWWSPSRPF